MLNVDAEAQHKTRRAPIKLDYPDSRTFSSYIMLRSLLLLSLLGFALIERVYSHEESGEWSCESGSDITVQAEFKPGLITIDGHADDWKDIDGFEFSLLPALDPHTEHEYKGGKMTVKVLF